MGLSWTPSFGGAN